MEEQCLLEGSLKCIYKGAIVAFFQFAIGINNKNITNNNRNYYYPVKANQIKCEQQRGKASNSIKESTKNDFKSKERKSCLSRYESNLLNSAE